MSSPLHLRPDDVRSVAVFRALQLGDMLCVVPALRALRARFPRAKITLIGLPWASSFVERFRSYIDDFVAFPGFPGLPEREPDLKALPSFFADMQARRFDLAIQLHGSGPIVNAIVEKMEPRMAAGFTLSDHDHAQGGLFLPWPASGHEIDIFLQIPKRLGAPDCGRHLEFPINNKEMDEFSALANRHRLEPGTYVCLHAGARLRSRRWPPDRFAAVADALTADGHCVVLTGSRDETHLTAEVARQARTTVLDLAGQTSLGGMAALLKNAALLVSNDTGASHIAAAVGTRSVVVTMGSDPNRWAPLDGAKHIPVFQPIDCRPCAYETCPIGHPCALAVTPDIVIEKARQHLQRRFECVPCES